MGISRRVNGWSWHLLYTSPKLFPFRKWAFNGSWRTISSVSEFIVNYKHRLPYIPCDNRNLPKICGKTASVADLNSSSVGGKAGRKNCFIVRRRSSSPAWNTIGVRHFEIFSKMFKNPRFSSTFVISSSNCLMLKVNVTCDSLYTTAILTWMIDYLVMIWPLWERILFVHSWHLRNDICRNILVSNIQKCVFEQNNCILEEKPLHFRHSTFRRFFCSIPPKVLKLFIMHFRETYNNCHKSDSVSMKINQASKRWPW